MSSVQNFPVGARVISYDFPGNRDCYVIGIVMEVGLTEYTILVEKRIIDAVVVDRLTGKTVRPPMNGLQGMFGLTNGVQLHA